METWRRCRTPDAAAADVSGCADGELGSTPANADDERVRCAPISGGPNGGLPARGDDPVLCTSTVRCGPTVGTAMGARVGGGAPRL